MRLWLLDKNTVTRSKTINKMKTTEKTRWKEAEANALIAELLATCKFALSVFDCDQHRGPKFMEGENPAIVRLKNAIAKAENFTGLHFWQSW